MKIIQFYFKYILFFFLEKLRNFSSIYSSNKVHKYEIKLKNIPVKELNLKEWMQLSARQ